MKKVIRFVLMVGISLGLASTCVLADTGKGQKIFSKEMKNACGYSGGVMAKKHTQAEWKKLFEAGKLNDELLKECPSARALKESYVEHVYDFLYNFASDSGNVPSC